MACCGDAVGAVIVPKTLDPSVTDKIYSNYYNIKSITKKSSKVQDTSIYTGINPGTTNILRVYEIHTKLMEVITNIIREYVNSNYEPPTYTGVGNGVFYDETGATVTDQLADLATFQTFIRNDTVNTTDPDLATADTLPRGKVEFIAAKLYTLFIRVKNHLESASVTDNICYGDKPRMFYMFIENCIFDLEFYYN